MRLTYEPRHEKTFFMPYENNNDADQPASDQRLCCSLPSSIIAILSKSESSRLKRAGLRVNWSDAPKGRFSHDVARI